MPFNAIRQFSVCVALAATLALSAVPAVAQTTVTSNGREGPTACLDKAEVDSADLPITALSTTSVTVTTPSITWNQYVGRLGDTSPPANVHLLLRVISAANAGLANSDSLGTINNRSDYEGESKSFSNLSTNTNYYVEVYARSTPVQVFARRCFMTGGTYTMTVTPNSTQGRNSGCFTVRPLTIQHVRNCWCGRKTTLPLFSSTQDNTDWLNKWGCR